MIVRYTQMAIDEIDGILPYIAKDSRPAAACVAAAIEQAVALIEHDPKSGPIVYSPYVRAKLVLQYPYRIFYMVRGSELSIRNVRSTRRQLPPR